MDATAGPTGLDVLRGLLCPLADGFAERRGGDAGVPPAAAPSGSMYPLTTEATAAAAPGTPWLLPLPDRRLRILRFAAADAWAPAATPAAADPYWAELVAHAGFGEAAAEARVSRTAAALRWRTGRPRPLLRAADRATRRRPVAAVA